MLSKALASGLLSCGSWDPFHELRMFLQSIIDGPQLRQTTHARDNALTAPHGTLRAAMLGDARLELRCVDQATNESKDDSHRAASEQPDDDPHGLKSASNRV